MDSSGFTSSSAVSALALVAPLLGLSLRLSFLLCLEFLRLLPFSSLHVWFRSCCTLLLVVDPATPGVAALDPGVLIPPASLHSLALVFAFSGVLGSCSPAGCGFFTGSSSSLISFVEFLLLLLLLIFLSFCIGLGVSAPRSVAHALGVFFVD